MKADDKQHIYPASSPTNHRSCNPFFRELRLLDRDHKSGQGETSCPRCAGASFEYGSVASVTFKVERSNVLKRSGYYRLICGHCEGVAPLNSERSFVRLRYKCCQRWPTIDTCFKAIDGLGVGSFQGLRNVVGNCGEWKDIVKGLPLAADATKGLVERLLMYCSVYRMRPQEGLMRVVAPQSY